MQAQMFNIIRATQKAARASSAIQEHARAMRDASRANDIAALERATRAHKAAVTRYNQAQADTLFPWERNA